MKLMLAAKLSGVTIWMLTPAWGGLAPISDREWLVRAGGGPVQEVVLA